ncbi:hypothetical protein FNV43_RR14077 [Rhamnella rubrinervis]|uniref:Uncharacterized protein n=1 Tax=Rhamnella rubrinervis TaxID=2594499 RepID=A0A8K0H2C0_9ROSA|nr:hypothetical protein FNV43_RR14077 [Rhamnella rubrinervis]
MGSASKELLKLEHDNAFSSLETSLLVCPNGSVSQMKNSHPHEKPITAPIPKSQVLGKVRNFLGVISEANEKLNVDAKENSGNYDIEVLTGNESQIIEMDLMLGIADLHTPEAVAAAESSITGCQPVIPLAVSSSGTESEDSGNGDDDTDKDDSDYDESDDSEKQYKKTCPPMKLKRSNSINPSSVNENVRDKSKKRSKIISISFQQCFNHVNGGKRNMKEGMIVISGSARFLMRVLFCKIHCPSFICFCKPSPDIYTPGPLKLENSPHVPSKPVSVPEASDQFPGQTKATEETLDGQQQPTENCRKSCLKKPNSDSAAPIPNEKQKKRVQWTDFLGKELVAVREFESSKAYKLSLNRSTPDEFLSSVFNTKAFW